MQSDNVTLKKKANFIKGPFYIYIKLAVPKTRNSESEFGIEIPS